MNDKPRESSGEERCFASFREGPRWDVPRQCELPTGHFGPHADDTPAPAADGGSGPLLIELEHDHDDCADCELVAAQLKHDADEIAALRAEVESDRLAMLSLDDEYNRLRAENEKLRAAIERAPHGQMCGFRYSDTLRKMANGFPCDCWKAAAFADEKEENRG